MSQAKDLPPKVIIMQHNQACRPNNTTGMRLHPSHLNQALRFFPLNGTLGFLSEQNSHQLGFVAQHMHLCLQARMSDECTSGSNPQDCKALNEKWNVSTSVLTLNKDVVRACMALPAFRILHTPAKLEN